MNIIDRQKALEQLLQQKVAHVQALTTQINTLTADAVKIQGKLELLKELEHESASISADIVKDEKKPIAVLT